MQQNVLAEETQQNELTKKRPNFEAFLSESYPD